MVKGVSKRIIEVNNTGNKFFEKIVIYVTPEYGNLSPSELKKATDGLFLGLREATCLSKPTLRRKYKRKRRLVLALSALGLLLVGGVILLIL